MTMDLFEDVAESDTPAREPLEPGAIVLRRFAKAAEVELLDAVRRVIEQAPLRHMVTPGGFRMSVAMTNCGELGWITDRKGYRYDRIDPLSGKPWPALPKSLLQLAASAAAEAGFSNFMPDACLINCYGPGTRLTQHQDKNEQDYTQPI